MPLWYPVNAGTVCARLGFGGQPSLFELPPVALDAPVADDGGPWPLAVLVGAGDPLHLGWLGVHLARGGYLAVAVGPGWSDVCDEDALRTACARVRTVTDGLFAVDLPGLGPLPGNYALAGFDRGGIVALVLAGAALARTGSRAQATQTHDGRVCAAALLNPAPASLLPRPGLAAVSVPVHVLVSNADRQAEPRNNGVALASGLRGARLTRLAAPAGHYVFHAEATRAGRSSVPLLAADAPVVHRGSVHQRSAALIAALFAEGFAARRTGRPIAG